jgi:DNA repair protein RecN (Recombination protein N)
MLKSLFISNYALIDEVQLNFHKGMTAITGETGSGKSILLGAFGMLLGERADSKSIRDEKQKCIVEAIFDLKGYGLKKFFKEADLDYEEQTTIRREISPGGKSRAFINDTPVQLATLRTLGEALVDIHSQHENSLLGQRDFQFGVVDAFAKNVELIREYNTVFDQYKEVKSELENVLVNEASLRRELDFVQFQLGELEKANLDGLDQQALEQELDTLNNAETIKSTLDGVCRSLDHDVQGVLPALKHAKSSVSKIESFNQSLGEFSKRLDSCYIELQDLNREMEAFGEGISTDDRRTEIINEELSQLYLLQKKHGLNSVEELIRLRAELAEKSQGFGNFDERIDELKNKVDGFKIEMTNLAGQITATRKKAAIAASSEVKKYFTELSLEHAELVIDISSSKDFHAFGLDEINFLFRANKGGQLQPVKAVASGGEISRVMLAIKASISKHKQLPVLILDEIDQGVSGEVGKKIGSILKGMSEGMQLLTITHLPQIAGKAEHHLKVFKTTDKNSTSTFVKEITGEDRVNELAEMLSGKSISKAAIENAKELMNN